ncbi:MAG TPA: hypothetical protein PLK71_01755 [Candidatus Paceibacterota bacterium]|jgi:hypothetical protein|nr:hypothetical protein [Candidatus Paceibacterota bacterium]HPB60511.1 hypothetical protein [Candidatus Paceibacterota bacterium]HPN89328.1 hypothetical protein [Candidatus Paceibacterota bacterium]HPY13232.1 hypothetical protein [Candidatus Paceibacterota bacterium]HQB27244.1 hypothetical protein [Candidatus Paceibacterota bacterium]
MSEHKFDTPLKQKAEIIYNLGSKLAAESDKKTSRRVVPTGFLVFFFDF